MKTLRIGCVKYLNARPLIRGWPGEVEFDHPSALCERLANGELDVALVSSFEFLRNPIYRIIDDVSISSDGPVYSVVVAHRDEISKIDEIELDPASETAVNLLRCLLGEFDLKPRLTRNIDLQSVRPAGLQPAISTPVQTAESQTAENISAGHTSSMPISRPPADLEPAFGTVRPAGLQRAESETAESISAGRTGKMPVFPARRAQLLIGDQAIRFRQKHTDDFQFWDLGEQWKKLIGLPFVYALWLIRPEVRDPKTIANRLRALRAENLAGLDELIAEVVAGVGDPGAREKFDPEFYSRYYHDHLRFSFGKAEKEGLRTFGQLCAKRGLLPGGGIAFNLV
ncbi:MAG: menaquinone biosynthesis protein [Candidatus Udaeobacter sp.]